MTLKTLLSALRKCEREAQIYRCKESPVKRSCAYGYERLADKIEAAILRRFEKASVVNGSTSDGYHTFDELYDHRCLLWIALILQPAIAPTSYWVREHFAGWDLLVHEDYGAQTQEQPYNHWQLSYHVPAKYRPLYEGKITETGANNAYDGHTSKDVLNRLIALCRRIKS